MKVSYEFSSWERCVRLFGKRPRLVGKVLRLVGKTASQSLY